MNLTYESIASRIDHALLLPTMTEAEMLAGCRMAARYEVASVCIKPFAVGLAAEALAGTVVRVGTVVGFPHGGQDTVVKVAETRQALAAGATEIDMVVNIGRVVGGQWDDVAAEIRAIQAATRDASGLLKVIFETCYLDERQKIRLCEICGEADVDYVKTSTGFGTGGATEEDIRLMRRSSPPSVKVKASGGIRDLDAAIRFGELGAERLGLSGTATILDALCDRLKIPRRDVSRETPLAPSSSNY